MLHRAAATHLPIRSIAIALIAAFAIFSPPAAKTGAAKVFDPQTFTLKNGMQVVVIRNPRAAVITHMVWYKVGAADEPAGQSGIAHYLEHLMFKGTKKLKAGLFSKIVARNGGRENAFTSQDYTAYFQVVASDRLETMMRHEADRMTGLVLSKEIIEPERGVVLEERRSRTDSRPTAILWEQARAALYQNHPYRVPIIGWAHEIKALSRDQIIAFYRKYYRPNNAILVVAGDISVEQLKPLAEKYYGAVPARPVPKRIRPMEPPQKAARRVTRIDARVRQASFGRMYLAPSYNHGDRKHVYALQVLSQILSGGATSRLNKSLSIDQKIADGVGAGYDPMVVDHATFYVYASPRAGVSVEKVETAMDAELRKLLDKGVTAEEVARAKQRLRDAAIYARDSLSTGARILGRALAVGLSINDVESWPERIGAVTVEQVNAAARAVLKRNSSVTAVLKAPARKADISNTRGARAVGVSSPAKVGGKQ
jgi:zinc protease